ncbi:NYN domain-containing protein [Schizophyllum commune]
MSRTPVENCHFTGGCSGFDIAKNIERVALPHGSVTAFNAYLDPQLCTISNNLRSELQSSGVALIDCPHNGQKNAVDQMLQTDILLFALDNPAPATLVLISGDRDFAYTAAVLRRRHYNVILICRSQPGPHRTLLSQVASHVDWATEILGFNEPEYDVRRRPPMQTPASPSSGSLRHVQSPSMSARNLERQEVTPPSPGPDQASPRRDRSSRSAFPAVVSAEVASVQPLKYQSPTKPDIRSANSSSIDPEPATRRKQTLLPSVLSPPETPAVPVATSRPAPATRISPDSAADIPSPSPGPSTIPAPVIPSEPTLPPPPPPVLPNAPLQSPHLRFEPLIRILRAYLEEGEPFPKVSAVGIKLIGSDVNAYANAGANNFKEYCSMAAAQGIVLLGGEGAKEWLSLSTPYTNADDDEDAAPDTLPQSAAVNLVPGVASPSYDLSSVTSTPSASSTSTPSTSNTVKAAAAQTSTSVLNNEDDAAEIIVQSGASTSLAPQQEQPMFPLAGGSTFSTTENAPSPSVEIPTFPAHFQSLMDVMRSLYAAGSSRPRRKELSGRLLRADKDVYQKAGLQSFKNYIVAATAAGLVAPGGSGAEAYVELAPAYAEEAEAIELPPIDDPSLPPQFVPLVQLLQAQLRAGYTKSNRQVVNTILRKRHPTLYGKLSKDCKDFSDYVYRARRANIITTGGGEGDESPWIQLEGRWHANL